MVGRPRKTIAGNLKTVRELEQDIQEYLDSGREIKKVAPGATGSPEGERSKHIVISRKPEPTRKKRNKKEGN